MAFERSEIKPTMDTELDFASSPEAAEWTRQFKAAVELDKAHSLSKKSPLTASFMTQVRACVLRQYQIIWGDKATFLIKQIVRKFEQKMHRTMHISERTNPPASGTYADTHILHLDHNNPGLDCWFPVLQCS